MNIQLRTLAQKESKEAIEAELVQVSSLVDDITSSLNMHDEVIYGKEEYKLPIEIERLVLFLIHRVSNLKYQTFKGHLNLNDAKLLTKKADLLASRIKELLDQVVLPYGDTKHLHSLDLDIKKERSMQ
jgi:hypothetical protein